MVPGIVLKAARQIANGARPDPAKIHVYQTAIYHRQDIGASGHTRLQFFAAAPSKFYTNYFSAGQLVPLDKFFWGFGVYVDLIFDGSAGDWFEAGTDAVALAQFVYETLSRGFLYLKVGDRVVVDRERLTAFPAGKGLAGFAAGTTSAGNLVIYPNNGVADVANMRRIAPMFPIYEQLETECLVEWETAIAPPSSAGPELEIGINGFLLSRANR